MYEALPGPELLIRALDVGWSAAGDELPQRTATAALNDAVNAQPTLQLKQQAQV